MTRNILDLGIVSELRLVHLGSYTVQSLLLYIQDRISINYISIPKLVPFQNGLQRLSILCIFDGLFKVLDVVEADNILDGVVALCMLVHQEGDYLNPY